LGCNVKEIPMMQQKMNRSASPTFSETEIGGVLSGVIITKRVISTAATKENAIYIKRVFVYFKLIS
jgi:hypothetical protein